MTQFFRSHSFQSLGVAQELTTVGINTVSDSGSAAAGGSQQTIFL